MTTWTKEQLDSRGLVKQADGNYAKGSSGADVVKTRPSARGKFATVKKNDSGMNKTEAEYAQHLEALKHAGQIYDWWFEKVTMKIAPDTRLTPDFLIQLPSGELIFDDVKGSMAIYQDDAKVKMKVAANTFPFRFRIVIPRTQKAGGGWEITEVKTDN